MKLVFASDIHGSAYYCKRLIEAYETEKAHRLVLLGDLLYHGPRNDLPEGYAPKEVAAMLNAKKDEIISVRGNCEAEVDQMMLEFPALADYAVLCAQDGRTGAVFNIYLTHGHHYNIDNPFPMKAGDVMIYGHTHVPLDCEKGGIRFLNPGSVSIPKENSGHGYIVYENGVFSRKLL